MNPIGTCALCRTDAVELIDSHTVSKWVYRRILTFDTGGGAQGVAVGGGRAGLSGAQDTAYLLCRCCEDRLGVWESYASRQALQPDSQTFPALAAASVIEQDAGLAVVALSLLEVQTLTLFAVSVFWRADVAQSDPIVDLGVTRENIRTYLLGGALPAEVDVVLSLIRPARGTPRVDRVLVFPGTDLEEPRRHEFIACGMRFTMFTSAPHIEEVSLPRKRRALVSEGRAILSGIAEETQTSTSYGKLAKQSQR